MIILLLAGNDKVEIISYMLQKTRTRKENILRKSAHVVSWKVKLEIKKCLYHKASNKWSKLYIFQKYEWNQK